MNNPFIKYIGNSKNPKILIINNMIRKTISIFIVTQTILAYHKSQFTVHTKYLNTQIFKKIYFKRLYKAKFKRRLT